MKRTFCVLGIILIGGAICPSGLAAQTNAAGLFKSKCVMCHGENGSGNTPSGKALQAKDLRSEETQKKSDAELAEVITKGRDKMPAFGQKLKPEQIQQLVAYIRQLAKK
jgi:mono/diheme cytochrome c family protein